MVDISTVAALLSSVANTGKILEYAMQMGAKVSPAQIQKAQQEAEAHAQEVVSHADLQQIANSGTLTDQILEKIIDFIGQARADVLDTWDKGLKEEIPPDVFDARLKAGRRKFCFGLYHYRQNKSGPLPQDMLDDWKKQFCDVYDFGKTGAL